MPILTSNSAKRERMKTGILCQRDAGLAVSLRMRPLFRLLRASSRETPRSYRPLAGPPRAIGSSPSSKLFPEKRKTGQGSETLARLFSFWGKTSSLHDPLFAAKSFDTRECQAEEGDCRAAIRNALADSSVGRLENHQVEVGPSPLKAEAGNRRFE